MLNKEKSRPFAGKKLIFTFLLILVGFIGFGQNFTNEQSKFSHNWIEVYPSDFPKYKILLEEFEYISEERKEELIAASPDYNAAVKKGVELTNERIAKYNAELKDHSEKYKLDLLMIKRDDINNYSKEEYRYVIIRSWSIRHIDKAIPGVYFRPVFLFYDRVENKAFSVKNAANENATHNVYFERKDFFEDMCKFKKGILAIVSKQGLDPNNFEANKDFENDVTNWFEKKRRSKKVIHGVSIGILVAVGLVGITALGTMAY